MRIHNNCSMSFVRGSSEAVMELNIIHQQIPGSWGMTVGTVGDVAEKVFVIRTLDGEIAPAGLYFADWQWNRETRNPTFKMVGHLSCARPFTDAALCESFSHFLCEHKCPCEIFEVSRGRLIRPVNLGLRSRTLL